MKRHCFLTILSVLVGCGTPPAATTSNVGDGGIADLHSSTDQMPNGKGDGGTTSILEICNHRLSGGGLQPFDVGMGGFPRVAVNTAHATAFSLTRVYPNTMPPTRSILVQNYDANGQPSNMNPLEMFDPNLQYVASTGTFASDGFWYLTMDQVGNRLVTLGANGLQTLASYSGTVSSAVASANGTDAVVAWATTTGTNWSIHLTVTAWPDQPPAVTRDFSLTAPQCFRPLAVGGDAGTQVIAGESEDGGPYNFLEIHIYQNNQERLYRLITTTLDGGMGGTCQLGRVVVYHTFVVHQSVLVDWLDKNTGQRWIHWIHPDDTVDLFAPDPTIRDLAVGPDGCLAATTEPAPGTLGAALLDQDGSIVDRVTIGSCGPDPTTGCKDTHLADQGTNLAVTYIAPASASSSALSLPIKGVFAPYR